MGSCHADAVVVAKDVSDISRIALGAVTDKDFAGFQIDAARSVIVPDDGIYQES